MPFNLQTLLNTIQESKDLIRTKGQEALGQAFKDFFDSCPEVRIVCWQQYAPYFNDGDPCEFSVHDPQVIPYPNKIEKDLAVHLGFDLDESDDEDGDSDDGDEDDEDEDGTDSRSDFYEGGMTGRLYGFREKNEREKRVEAAFSTLAEAFKEDDLFETVFGSNCQVVASRDGFDIQDCDHD